MLSTELPRFTTSHSTMRVNTRATIRITYPVFSMNAGVSNTLIANSVRNNGFESLGFIVYDADEVSIRTGQKKRNQFLDFVGQFNGGQCR